MTRPEPRTPRDVDVCVVGSGASGSIAARELVRSGLRVLVLEQGSFPRAGDCLHSMEPAWPPALITAHDGTTKPLGRPWSACAVGGGMSIFAGIAFRLRLVDFDAAPHAPADALDPAWPITYADLRPWYDEVEQVMGIARLAQADPTEPESPAPIMPPHPFSPAGRLLAEAGTTLGLHPFPTPLAINSVQYRGRPACHRCGPCNEYVCPSGAKADAASLLAPLARSDALTISAQSRALRILLGSATSARAIEWLDLRARQRHVTTARVIVLAANAVQSAALLLNSQCRWAPAGLGNRHDMVGRGLSFKVSRYVTGHVRFPRERWEPSVSLAGPFSTVSFTDHYVTPGAPGGLGGLIYEASGLDRQVRSGQFELRLHCLAADQPMRRNRVRLATRTDADGLARLVLDYRTHDTDAARLRFLADSAQQILRAAGATNIAEQESGYQFGSRHLHGTCRAGSDPRSSVVDRWGRLHDLDNLYVVDGGYFPYAGGVNPTFTIQANAGRISAEIARRLGCPTADHHPSERVMPHVDNA